MSRRWKTVTVVLVLLVVAGGIITWRSFADSPAARIAAASHVDQRRARKMASAKNTMAPSSGVSHSSESPQTSVSWDPTVAGQVASLTIPALGVSNAPVIGEQVSGGYLTIPADVHNVGWDDQTPAPGQAGITLLAGHVNWAGQGEGSMGQIGQLVPGDQVLVNWHGVQSSWTVFAHPTMSPNSVVHTSLFTDSGSPRLALVTCGGPFSETASGWSYADNVIVEAVPSAA